VSTKDVIKASNKAEFTLGRIEFDSAQSNGVYVIYSSIAEKMNKKF